MQIFRLLLIHISRGMNKHCVYSQIAFLINYLDRTFFGVVEYYIDIY